jgi:hypothetical protein
VDRGFQVVLTAYPELSRQLDVDALDLRRFDPGVVVRVGDRFHRVGDPLRMPLTIGSDLMAPVGTIADKARLARWALALRRRGAARTAATKASNWTANRPSERPEARFAPSFPIAARSAGLAARVAMRCSNASASPGGTMNPASPSGTRDRISPAAEEEITGMAANIASSTTSPWGSPRVGKTNTSASA